MSQNLTFVLSTPNSSPQTCVFCLKSYGCSKTLRRHQKEKHRPQPPKYPCPAHGCKRSMIHSGFSRRHGLNRHMRYCKVLSNLLRGRQHLDSEPSFSSPAEPYETQNERLGKSRSLNIINESLVFNDGSELFEEFPRALTEHDAEVQADI